MFRIFKLKVGLALSVLALIMTLVPLGAAAQANVTITGTVVDHENEPLIGASVVVKNTTNGVVTNIDGEYTITAPANAILVFNYIGCSPVEEKVNGRSTINVTLKPDAQMMDEVVVVGYGVQRRGSITGSVAAIRGADMVKTNNENPQNMLTGKIPGVRVWQQSAEPGAYKREFGIRPSPNSLEKTSKK